VIYSSDLFWISYKNNMASTIKRFFFEKEKKQSPRTHPDQQR